MIELLMEESSRKSPGIPDDTGPGPQETRASNTAYRVYRGQNSVTYSNFIASSNTHNYYGWRPRLELMTS